MTTEFRSPPSYLQEELTKIANYLMSPGKGIIALDQSTCTLGLRLEEIMVENKEENRLKFLDLIINSTEDLGQYVSGIIITPETLELPVIPDESVVQNLKKKGIVTGVKVDVGLLPLMGSIGECFTAGLAELAELCSAYKQNECHFTKWRCVYRVGDISPSPTAISNNAAILARFASISQSQRLVPIVEPEILPEGSHSLDRAQKITETVLAALFKSLNDHHVFLEGMILKVNFITPGMKRTITYIPEEIGETTLTALERTVPTAVAGIVFLAGGHTEDLASLYLDATCRLVRRRPWPLSYSFGRGLWTSAMKAWGGDDFKVEEARLIFLERLKMNCLASYGMLQDERDKEMRRLQKEEEKTIALKKFVGDKKLRTHRFNDATMDSE